MKVSLFLLTLILPLLSAAADNAAEAGRFFGEYEARLAEVAKYSNSRGSEFDSLKPLLETAAALAPDDPRYRRELIILELTRVHDSRISWRERLNILRNFLKETGQFYASWPGYQHPRQEVFTWSRHGKNPIDAFSNLTVSRATEAERSELADIFTEIRKLRDREKRQMKFYSQLKLSGDINSARELYVCSEWVRCGTYYNWYYDTAAMVRDNYRQELEFYRHMRDFLKRHPEARKRNLSICSSFPFPMPAPQDNWRQAETIAELKKIFDNFDEMSNLVKEIDYEPLTARHYNWMALKDFLHSNHSAAPLKRTLFRLLENLDNHIAGTKSIETFQVGATYLYPESLRPLYIDLQGFRQEYEARKSPEDTFQTFLAGLKNGNGANDLKRIRQFTPELRNSALKAICDNATRNAFCRIESHLRNSPASGTGELLDALNAAWRIRELRLSNYTCRAATESAGNYYLLLQDSTSGKLEVVRLIPETMSLKPLLPPPGLDGRQFQPRMYGQGSTISMSVSGGRLILGGENSVAIYDPEARVWTFVTDLPGFDVVSARITGGRCYVLLGGRTSSETLAMCSFALDGSALKLHFSARRADKQTPLDSLPKGKLSDLIELPDGKLLFAVHHFGKPAHLYRFSPDTEIFEKLREFDNTNTMALRDQGEFILGNSYGFGFRFFKLDKKTLAPAYFLTQEKDDARWAKANQVKQLKGMWELQSPFLLADGFLISACNSNCPLVLNLENPEASPLLMVPAGVHVFRLKEKTFLFIGAKQISEAILK